MSKLTTKQFPYPVEFIDDRGWKYLGNDCAELAACAEIVREAGEKLVTPWNESVRLANKTSLDMGMVLFLIALEQQQVYLGLEWIRYPTQFPRVQPQQARGFSSNYSYLVHFDLIEKDGPHNALDYRVTEKGVNFLSGKIACSEFVLNRGRLVLDESEAQARITDYFARRYLDAFAESPLWWEEEAERVRILGPCLPVNWDHFPKVLQPEMVGAL